MENGITIHHKGESYDIPLYEEEADHISDLTIALNQAPRVPDPSGLGSCRLPAERVKARGERHKEYRENGEKFQTVLRRIAKLDENQTALMLAFLDVLEMGDIDGESNWIPEFIGETLNDVIFEGAAGAVHQDPRPVISSLCYRIARYWEFVRDARRASEHHPALFPALHQKPEEPEPKKPARKPRKKAA